MIIDLRARLAERVDHIPLVEVVSARDRHRGVAHERGREHTESIEHDALRVVEHRIRPLDRRPQRLVPLHPAPAAPAEQPEPLIEVSGDLGRLHRHDPRRRELDRQRNVVEPLADLLDRHPRCVVDREVAHRSRPIDEQPERVLRGDRAEAVHVLTLDRQRLPARRNDANRRAAAQHELGKLRGRVEQVLAVVEHEEQLLALQEVDDALPAGHARPVGTSNVAAITSTRLSASSAEANSHSQAPSGNSGTTSAATCIASRVLPTPPTPVSVTRWCSPIRRPITATASTRPTKLVTCTGRFPGRAVDRPQLREARRQALVDQLEHPHRLREIPEAVLTEVPQRDVGHDLVGGGRHQHLAAVADRHEPGGPVHRRPEVVTVAFHRLTGVHGHANRREALAQ